MIATFSKWLPARLRQRLSSSPRLQQIVGNVGWLLFDKALRLVIGVLIGVWLARYLGAEQFGRYSYAMAFAALFSPLVSLGLDSLLVRDLVRDPQLRNEILGTACLLKLGGAALATLLALAAITLLRPGEPIMLALVVISSSVGFFQAFDVIEIYFQSQVQARYSVWARNLAVLLAMSLRAALIVAGAPLIAFALVNIVELALIAGGLLVAYRWQVGSLRAWRPRLALAGQLLRASWPLIFSGLAVMIYMKIDQVMLGTMLGDSAVGIYGAATRISESWYMLPSALVASFAPTILATRGRDHALYLRRLQQLATLLVGFCYAVALPVTLLADPLITLVYGPAYSAAGPVLAVHIWAAIFVALGLARSPWVIGEGATLFSLASTASGALLNVLLNLVLIPLYGPLGAAIATLIAYASAVLICPLIWKPARPIGVILLRALALWR